MKLLASLRFRLMLLVLLSFLPALGLTLYTSIEQNRSAAFDAGQNALRLSRIMAGLHERFVQETSRLLFVTSRVEAVRHADAERSVPLLAGLLKQYPVYANLLLFRADGSLCCSGAPAGETVDVGHAEWFRRMVGERNFVFSGYEQSPTEERLPPVFAYPVEDDDGRLIGVLAAPVSMAWLNTFALQTEMPPGSSFTIRNTEGKILARHPNPELWVGKSLPDTSVTKAILSQRREGVAEAIGIDGMRRVYAFTPLQENIFLSIGIPADAVFGGLDRMLWRNVAYLAVAALIGFGAASFISRLLIERRVYSLVEVTKRLASGDLKARVGLPHNSGELGLLGKTFDEMADALEASNFHLRQAEIGYRTLVEQIPVVVYKADLDRIGAISY
ncbi:MAG: HAMP domain-containing protein, partial [Acidobacteriota bacterium]